MKYMGSGTGVNNRYALVMDNQEATAIEAMSVLQDGKVGIGTASPSILLDVDGVSGYGGALDTTDAGISYAVASGVTAILGYTSMDATNDGSSNTGDGSAWYIGANMAF